MSRPESCIWIPGFRYARAASSPTPRWSRSRGRRTGAPPGSAARRRRQRAAGPWLDEYTPKGFGFAVWLRRSGIGRITPESEAGTSFGSPLGASNNQRRVPIRRRRLDGGDRRDGRSRDPGRAARPDADRPSPTPRAAGRRPARIVAGAGHGPAGKYNYAPRHGRGRRRGSDRSSSAMLSTLFSSRLRKVNPATER